MHIGMTWSELSSYENNESMRVHTAATKFSLNMLHISFKSILLLLSNKYVISMNVKGLV